MKRYLKCIVFSHSVFHDIHLVKYQRTWGHRTALEADRQALPARPQHPILLRLQRQQVSRSPVGKRPNRTLQVFEKLHASIAARARNPPIKYHTGGFGNIIC